MRVFYDDFGNVDPWTTVGHLVGGVFDFFNAFGYALFMAILICGVLSIVIEDQVARAEKRRRDRQAEIERIDLRRAENEHRLSTEERERQIELRIPGYGARKAAADAELLTQTTSPMENL